MHPRCPSCHVEIQPDWDWCHNCGFDPDGLRPVPGGPPSLPVPVVPSGGWAPPPGSSPSFPPPGRILPPAGPPALHQGPGPTGAGPTGGGLTGGGPPSARDRRLTLVAAGVGALIVLGVLVAVVMAQRSRSDDGAASSPPASEATGATGPNGANDGTTTSAPAVFNLPTSAPPTTTARARVFTASDGSFTAGFPAAPALSGIQAPDPDFSVFHEYALGEYPVLYAVEFGDLSEGTPFDLQATLNGLPARMAEQVGGRATGVQRTEVDGRPAIRASIDHAGDGSVARVEAVVNGRRLYIVLAIGPSDSAPLLDAFIDSFGLPV